MELDKRSQKVLLDILQQPSLSSKDISLKYELSRGQLNYTLEKINSFLETKELPNIVRNRQGYFVVHKEITYYFSQMSDSTKNIKLKDYIYSVEERSLIILLLILSRKEYLSLDHLVDELKVSRNTVLRDVKDANELLNNYQLTLSYQRALGYVVTGDEWNKRLALNNILNKLMDGTMGELIILHFANISPEELYQFKSRLEIVEKELHVEFTDERLKTLPLLIILVIRRIHQGKLINYTFKINYKELSDTEEYIATDRVLWDVENISENERIYLTLQLLTTNVSRSNILSANELGEMRLALKSMLSKFEQVALITLHDKEGLLEKLMMHMRPAYYRIKYNLNLNSKFFDSHHDDTLNSMYFLVKKSLYPLEYFLDKRLPEIEVFFISILIAGHIMDNTDILFKDYHKKAIIVCPNGVSISMLLENTLKSLLPEIDFVSVLSTRNFYRYPIEEIDYVFSVVPLKTDKKVFVVDGFLSDNEKQLLRKQVLEADKESYIESISLNQLMGVIQQYAHIEDEELLRHALKALDKTNRQQKPYQLSEPKLYELINSENTFFYENPISWLDLLTDLGKVLEKQGKISSNYTETIKKEMPTVPSYILLGNKLALPHSAPENGAYELGISLAVLKHGIETLEGPIHTVVFLASKDKEEHINILYELLNLSMSPKLSMIESQVDRNEIIKEIHRFSLEEQEGK